MIGAIQRFFNRLSNVVAGVAPFYLIWCVAHQLDIIRKASTVSMQTLVSLPLEKTLTTLVGYLLQQKPLIRTTESKCFYWINVRWKLASNVLHWQLKNRVWIQSFCIENQFSSKTAIQWYLVTKILQKQFFEQINAAFSALQIDSAVVSKQYDGFTKLLLNIQAQSARLRNE